jgi:hypothetical protein
LITFRGAMLLGRKRRNLTHYHKFAFAL